MNTVEQERRSFLLGLGGVALGPFFPKGATGDENSTRSGYVLPANGGEHLIHFRDHGNMFINVSPASGSGRMAWGMQQVTLGAGIPTHRHLEMDEAFFVLEGSGVVTLNDVEHPLEKGGTVFIPKMCWHGFSNPDHELVILWTVAPAGLEGFFRETCSPPGVPPKQLTREQIREIGRKYGTEFR